MTVQRDQIRRGELEAILASETFRQAARLRQVLRYIGEEWIEGRSEEISQKSIANAVFGIPPTADARYQVVRRSVNELRKKLALYYSREGALRPLRLVIPPGSYHPILEEPSTPLGTIAPMLLQPEGKRPVGAGSGAPEAPLAADPGEPPAEGAARWRPEPHSVILGIGATFVLLVLGLLGMWFLGGLRGGVPRDTDSQENVLRVLDGRGRQLWSATLEGRVHRLRLITDLDGDGEPEVIAATSNRPGGDWEAILYAFDSGGRELWRLPLAPEDEVPFEGAPYRGPYRLVALTAEDLEGDGRADLIVLIRHMLWFPSRALRISPTGEVLGSYWHPGHLMTAKVVTRSGDGRKLLVLGGCNNGYGRRPALLLLDPLRMDGRGPAEPGSQYEARGLSLAEHAAYLLLPRSAPSLSYPEIVPFVAQLMTGDDGTIRAHTKEYIGDPSTPGRVVYLLDGEQRLERVGLSDPLHTAYKEMAREQGLPEPDFDRVEEEMAARVQVLRDGAFVPLSPGTSAVARKR